MTRICEMCEQREALPAPVVICRRCNLDTRWHIWFNAKELSQWQLTVMEMRLWLGELRWSLAERLR